MAAHSVKHSFIKDIVTLWPGLPYLGFGVLSAWMLLSYSGTFWLSNTEIDGRYISHLYLLATGVCAILMLVTPFLSIRIQEIFERPAFSFIGAALTGIGALLIILAGPFYLAVSWLFYFGSVLAGIGTIFLVLRLGHLYGQLEPSKIVVYVVLSQLLVAALYFLFIGTEWYHPIEGGPSLSGILGLVFLPLFAAILVSLPKANTADSNVDKAISGSSISKMLSLRQVPVSFWKLCIAVFVFAIVTSVVKGLATHFGAPSATVINSNLLMLLRVLFAVVFLYFTFQAVRRVNFGKLYLTLMVGISIAVTLASSMQLFDGAFALFVGFSLDVFDILLWCMLALIVHQSRASFVVVFGFGRGAFMLGGVIGWMIGAWLVPMISSTFWVSLLLIFLATLVLVCAILVFSEKDFDRLFSTVLESEITLMDLTNHQGRGNNAESGDYREAHQRPYAEACKLVAAKAQLTERERGIFELLALGRGNENIAEKLHISMNTVRTHTQNIYYKLDIHSRHDLVTLVEAAKDEMLS